LLRCKEVPIPEIKKKKREGVPRLRDLGGQEGKVKGPLSVHEGKGGGSGNPNTPMGKSDVGLVIRSEGKKGGDPAILVMLSGGGKTHAAAR